MTAVTIKFRAKRDEYYDFDASSYRAGYKIPTLTHSHVSFSERDTVAQLLTQGLNNADVTKARLALYGLKLPAYVFDDSGWTITPVGNGFMADISITHELNRTAGAVR